MTGVHKTLYEADVIAWAKEQARLLRAGHFDGLDIEHIAEEIEDVAKSEQRDLESRMTVLLSHLLKWQHQPERRNPNGQRIIKEQRKAIARHIGKVPSLVSDLQDGNWWDGVWGEALIKTADEAGIDFASLPGACPWSEEQVFSADFFPA